MKFQFLCGWEFWLLGAFWSKQNRSWYIYPFFLIGLKITLPLDHKTPGAAPRQRRREIDKPIEHSVICKNCGHGAIDHHAQTEGYHRGAMNEVVADVSWTCTAIVLDPSHTHCPCRKFEPEVANGRGNSSPI